MNINAPLYSLNKANRVGERIYKTSILDLYYISTEVHTDKRGFYREIALLPDLSSVLGFEFNVKQLNHAQSLKNVIRGMHAEDWNKLVTITHGVGLCVLADVRPDSPTFGKKEYFLLGFGDRALSGSLFVSKKIANSICVVTEPVEYIYAVDQLYRDRETKGDVAISLFDPHLNIEWPIQKEEMVISDRDRNSVTLKDLFPEKFM